MNKEQAAAYLGVSVRTLQRLTGKGKIPVTYERGHKGDEARYGSEDLDRYLQSQRPVALMRPDSGATDDTTRVMTVTRDTPDSRREFAQMIAEAIAAKPALSLADKLTLSLIEAAQLSGLSRGHLREAIEAKKLKARIIGRGWRVKRDDLEAYVRKL